MSTSLPNSTRVLPDGPYTGFIRGHTGTSPGPKDGIKYIVEFDLPSSGTVKIYDIVPSNNRPTAADIDAASDGTFVQGYMRKGTLYVTIIEQYAGGGCP